MNYFKYLETHLSKKSVGFLLKMLLFVFSVALLIFRNTQHISDRMFWLDEVISFKIASNSFFDIPLQSVVYMHHMQPPLFPLLGNLASHIGTDPLILRSVSVFCYICLIGFIIFCVSEFKLTTRFFLCFVLITTPFAEYAVTEFRPYALAALSILTSSFFFYRMMRNPQSWKAAILYFLSALLLFYSLTLNCFVFGVQMLFILGYLLPHSLKNGIAVTLSQNKPITAVSTILCSQYVLVLLFIIIHSIGVTNGSLSEYYVQLIENFQIFKNSVQIAHPSLSSYLVISLFIVGSTISFRLTPWVTLYLLGILLGQILFSTYVTYATIPWFSQRYLVASYVSFACLAAIGCNIALNRFKDGLLVLLIAGAAIGVMHADVKGFHNSLAIEINNPSRESIETLRCQNNKTIVITDPLYWSLVPWYIYRTEEMVEVPVTEAPGISSSDIDISTIVEQGALENNCFILQEAANHKYYTGRALTMLNNLPTYGKYKLETKGGTHVARISWLFFPN